MNVRGLNDDALLFDLSPKHRTCKVAPHLLIFFHVECHCRDSEESPCSKSSSFQGLPRCWRQPRRAFKHYRDLNAPLLMPFPSPATGLCVLHNCSSESKHSDARHLSKNWTSNRCPRLLLSDLRRQRQFLMALNHKIIPMFLWCIPSAYSGFENLDRFLQSDKKGGRKRSLLIGKIVSLSISFAMISIGSC